MIRTKCESKTVRIWIAGDYDDARRVVRKFCSNDGACFSVSKVDYIYTGGEELGVCVTRINYPRFPETLEFIFDQCLRLAEELRRELFQKSFSIEDPEDTHWFSWRDKE